MRCCSRSPGTAPSRGWSRLLSPQLVRFQFRTILAPGRAEQSHAEHRAIVEAVAKGDADAAEQAVREHLAHVVAAMRSQRRTHV